MAVEKDVDGITNLSMAGIFAGKEMEQHVSKGGVFEEIVAIMDEEIGKSDFFRALRERAEKEDAADQSQKEAEEK